MLTTNSSLASSNYGVEISQPVPRLAHGDFNDNFKSKADCIVFPSIEQLDDFFDLLPSLKNSGISVFTETSICLLLRTADPLEATSDLLDRGVNVIAVLRPRSILIAVNGQVSELRAPNGVRPHEHLLEYLNLLRMYFTSDRLANEAILDASSNFLLRMEKNISVQKRERKLQPLNWLISLLWWPRN